MFGKFSKKKFSKKTKDSKEETSTTEEEPVINNVVIQVNEKASYDAAEEVDVVDALTTKVQKVIEDLQQAVSAEEPTEEEVSKNFFLQSKLVIMKVGSILDRSVDASADKIMYWQSEAARDEDEKKEDSPDKEQKEDEAEAVKEPSRREKMKNLLTRFSSTGKEEEAGAVKEGEDEEFAHKVEVFVDGAAIQTIRLTSAGMERLKTFLTEFLAQVQEDERYKDASEKVLNFWLVEKLTAFFNTAKEQELAKDENQVASDPEEPVVAAEEEETSPEIDAFTGVKSMISQWWPFGNAEAEEITPEDDVRNDETVEGVEMTAEEAREIVVEAA
jgi:hypothetical protein